MNFQFIVRTCTCRCLVNNWRLRLISSQGSTEEVIDARNCLKHFGDIDSASSTNSYLFEGQPVKTGDVEFFNTVVSDKRSTRSQNLILRKAGFL